METNLEGNLKDIIRFRTFHVLDDDAKEIGKITAARRFDDDGSVLVAFSFCSPKDKYNKKMGQLRAAGRLLNKPKKRYRTFNASVQEMKDLAIAVAEQKGIKWLEKAKTLV